MSLAEVARNDAVRKLSAILQPVTRRRLLGVLVAYVDESGTHDKSGLQPGSKVAGLAGYVASEREWTRFSKRWNKILLRYGVALFHLSDFERRKPPYGDWPDTKAERFVDELTAAIRKIHGYGLGAMVESRAHDALSPIGIKTGKLARYQHTYYFSLSILLGALLDNLSVRFPQREKLAIVFDRQQQFKTTALRICDAMRLARYDGFRIGTVKFSPKDGFPPLQAADCLVHWMRRDAEDHVYTGRAGARLCHLLPRGRHIEMRLMNEAKMRKHAARMEKRLAATAHWAQKSTS
jgi:hypothetical protein